MGPRAFLLVGESEFFRLHPRAAAFRSYLLRRCRAPAPRPDAATGPVAIGEHGHR